VKHYRDTLAYEQRKTRIVQKMTRLLTRFHEAPSIDRRRAKRFYNKVWQLARLIAKVDNRAAQLWSRERWADKLVKGTRRQYP
jgi:thiamine kinase-like enzyme